jgi:hypothetical protein
MFVDAVNPNRVRRQLCNDRAGARHVAAVSCAGAVCDRRGHRGDIRLMGRKYSRPAGFQVVAALAGDLRAKHRCATSTHRPHLRWKRMFVRVCCSYRDDDVSSLRGSRVQPLNICRVFVINAHPTPATSAARGNSSAVMGRRHDVASNRRSKLRSDISPSGEFGVTWKKHATAAAVEHDKRAGGVRTDA